MVGLLSEVRSLDGEVGWGVYWVFEGNSLVDGRGAEIACHRLLYIVGLCMTYLVLLLGVDHLLSIWLLEERC